MNQTVSVHTESGNTEDAYIGRVVRQRCLVLSPLLFNIYAEAMTKEALEESQEGMKVGDS